MPHLATTAATLFFSLFLPLVALATPLTLTFDLGFMDTTITDPTGDYHGPYAWLEGGARISGFWAQNVGTAQGAHVLGHIHPSDHVGQPIEYAPYGYMTEYTHSYAGDLQGLIISLENGGTFDLVSLDYDVQFLEAPGDPWLERLPWSFAASDPQILLATSFDPSAPDFESQWTAFDAISTAHGTPYDVDFHTLDFSAAAFTNLTSIMISQTAAQTFFDNIVIDVHDGLTPVPEPSTALLMAIGLAARARSSKAEAVKSRAAAA